MVPTSKTRLLLGVLNTPRAHKRLTGTLSLQTEMSVSHPSVAKNQVFSLPVPS